MTEWYRLVYLSLRAFLFWSESEDATRSLNFHLNWKIFQNSFNQHAALASLSMSQYESVNVAYRSHRTTWLSGPVVNINLLNSVRSNFKQLRQHVSYRSRPRLGTLQMQSGNYDGICPRNNVGTFLISYSLAEWQCYSLRNIDCIAQIESS